MQAIEAVYEKGMFRPFKYPKITEGQKVKLFVELVPKSATDDILDLAGQVYDGLSVQDIDEIERIALDRSDFFRKDI